MKRLATYTQYKILRYYWTERTDEWAYIWRRRCDPLDMRRCFEGDMRGKNRYERAAMLAELDDLIETYKKANHLSGSGVHL